MAYYGVQAAVDKEREACHRRLSEMSAHFEEQMHAQRLRATGQARLQQLISKQQRGEYVS